MPQLKILPATMKIKTSVCPKWDPAQPKIEKKSLSHCYQLSPTVRNNQSKIFLHVDNMDVLILLLEFFPAWKNKQIKLSLKGALKKWERLKLTKNLSLLTSEKCSHFLEGEKALSKLKTFQNTVGTFVYLRILLPTIHKLHDAFELHIYWK